MDSNDQIQKELDGYNCCSMEDTEQSADNLSTNEGINLRHTFPIAHRSVFARAWLPLSIFFALIILLWIGSSMVDKSNNATGEFTPLLSSEGYDYLAYYLFYVSLLVLSLQLLWEELYQMTYYYGIEAEHLIITTGVLLRHRNSLHISLITDIFLKRNVLELLFFTYSIQLANPSPEAPRTDEISFLSKRDAICLQDFLVNLIKEVHVSPMVGATNSASPVLIP
jgi:hypothetical protein